MQAIAGQENRSLSNAMVHGAKGKCPACGRAPLFARRLEVADHCAGCGTALHHHQADDLPAYLNIFLVGHVVVGAMMVLMSFVVMPIWAFTALTVAVAVLTAFYLMRPIKGMVVGAQWALRMHGFDEDGA